VAELCHILRKSGDDWIYAARFVRLEFARGYLLNEHHRYPSEDMRIVKAMTGDIVVDQTGNKNE
jgi:hypothetical protein